MPKKLITLEDHNKQTNERYMALNWCTAQPNGIACPECGEELVDNDPNIQLPTMPPQKNVSCLKCGYKGYRYA